MVQMDHVPTKLPSYYPQGSPPLSDFLPAVSPIPEQFEFPDIDLMSWKHFSYQGDPTSKMETMEMEAIPALSSYFGSSTTGGDEQEEVSPVIYGSAPDVFTPVPYDHRSIQIKLEEPEDEHGPYIFEPLSESSNPSCSHVNLPFASQLSLPSHSESSADHAFVAPPLVPYFDILLAQSLPPVQPQQQQQEQNITNEQFYDTVSEMLAESCEPSAMSSPPPSDGAIEDEMKEEDIAGEEDSDSTSKVFRDYVSRQEVVDSHGQT